MKRTFSLLILSLLAMPFVTDAAGPKVWVVESPKEFAAGEGESIRFDPDGGISLAPSRQERGRFSGESILLSVVRASNGDLYAGTGFGGAVYRIARGRSTPVKVTNLEEPAVFSLAAGPNGEVWAAGSPGGRIYRVDGLEPGAKPRRVAETGEKYIWAMIAEKSGDLLVATGDQGKLLRVTSLGASLKTSVLLDSSEPNIRSLAKSNQTTYCGTDGRALVYRLTPDQNPEIVGSANRAEISSLLPAPDGSLLILATSGDGAFQPPPTPAKPSAPASAGASDAIPAGIVSVSVDTSFVPPATTSKASFELLRLRTDGLLEPIAAVDDEVGYALAPSPRGDATAWIAAGPKGRIYALVGRQLALLRELPEKNVVALVADGDAGVIAATADGPALHLIGSALEAKGVYRSSVHAEDRRSQWGAYGWEGSSDRGKVRAFFRSGGSPTPDESWSDWSEAKGTREGAASAPPNRYVQWKLELEGEGGSSPFVRSFSLAATSGNLAPAIESLSVHDPGVIFVRGTYGGGNVVVEAANPDEKGMFTVVGEAKERPEAGKKMFRRGFRTLTWKATDPNDDSLLFDVSFRDAGSDGRGQGDWIFAARNLSEPSLTFDASVLPDGVYLFRVRASDEKSNAAGEALESTKSTPPVVVDGSPPGVLVKETGRQGKAIRFRAEVSDALSPILRAELSVDGREWVALRPADGSADSRREVFELEAASEGSLPRFVVFRVIDTSYNVATSSCLGAAPSGTESERR